MAPASERARVAHLGDRMVNGVGNYVMGKACVALVNATVAFVLMTITGVPYASLLVLLVGLLAFIPAGRRGDRRGGREPWWPRSAAGTRWCPTPCATSATCRWRPTWSRRGSCPRGRGARRSGHRGRGRRRRPVGRAGRAHRHPPRPPPVLLLVREVFRAAPGRPLKPSPTTTPRRLRASCVAAPPRPGAARRRPRPRTVRATGGSATSTLTVKLSGCA
ncbi:AI-2E family transporter [Kocuria rhizophila]|nr:AI-2E family transporter [Kocuria rhizophila]